MTEQALCNAMRLHGGAVYRLALCRLQNAADAEDVYQDVFLRLFEQEAADWDGEHTRAWLLRATVNRCTDIHRFRLRRPVLPLEAVPDLARADRRGSAEIVPAAGAGRAGLRCLRRRRERPHECRGHDSAGRRCHRAI